ncbi:MAG: long-chain-fatty-acid--CoA ligase [Acetobacteraceae bacterium]|nr:long-chain-fatty-acid--CoA ligase [Acetobacteraceae bacterium]
MEGLMQRHPLMISALLTHAARHHPNAEVVSKTVEGAIHRYTYKEAERRARRLARVLLRLGVEPHDRIGTIAWNGHRHFEIYYATAGMGAICHTINPRLHPNDLSYMIGHASDRLLFADTTFAPLIAAVAPRVRESVRAVVMMTDAANMPDLALAPGMDLLCYETLMAESDEDYAWPVFDENTASTLCYTSGTTGRPKGVLYSHRSTWLHAYAVNQADALALRATDRVLPVVPMFHVNAWGTPYTGPMSGATLVMPGRHLDGASLHALMNEERVTMAAGVPTVWMGLLQHLQASGGRLETVKRMLIGGSACPQLLIEAFDREYGVRVTQGWGMTEISPVGAINAPKPAHAGLSESASIRQRLKQGRILPGLDVKIVNDAGKELPWDGVQFGDLLVRGPWVCSAYFGDPPGSACDAEGWFATGDVATIDPNGYIELTDRSKDVIKSGGEWISSITLENIALSHPEVAEAAVVGAIHPRWDERPLLIVVPKQGCAPTPESVLSVYEGKVPRWWLPDAVAIVPELPHTATGKLLKTALRAQYRDYLVQHHVQRDPEHVRS